MVIQPLIGNPYNGYIKPYYWVDDHPLLYGNCGSLDPSTYSGSLGPDLLDRTRHFFAGLSTPLMFHPVSMLMGRAKAIHLVLHACRSQVALFPVSLHRKEGSIFWLDFLQATRKSFKRFRLVVEGRPELWWNHPRKKSRPECKKLGKWATSQFIQKTSSKKVLFSCKKAPP